MGEHVAYVGVGSNIDPERNIPEALRRLAENVSVEAASRFYRTEPLGRPGQPPFLNGVVRVRTALDAEILKFKVLRGIEKALGRERTADTYAPRAIDLDLLLFDTVVIERPELRIPDPNIRTRPFLVIPLLELDPELILPDTGERLAEIACHHTPTALTPMDAFTEALRNALTRFPTSPAP